MRQKLKRYFIPHAENNYHPHILHTKRTVFYSLFFLLVKGLAVVCTLLLPLPVFVSPDVLLPAQDEVLRLTNNFRLENNKSLLNNIAKLNRSASLKSADMSASGYFSHVSPDGKKLKDFLSAVGYAYAWAGENLAMGYSDPVQLVKAWIESPTHRANLLDDYVDFGVGMESGYYDGKPTAYVAQHFGTPKFISAKLNQAVIPAAVQSDVIISSSTVSKQVTAANINSTDIAVVKPAVTNTAVNVIVSPVITSTNLVLGAVDMVSVATSSVSVIPVAYNRDISRISWEEKNKEMIEFSPQVYLSGPIKIVYVQIAGEKIFLQPSKIQVDNFINYSAQQTLSVSTQEIFKVVLAPSLVIENNAGDIILDTVPWERALSVSPTPIERYLLARKDFPLFGSIFDFSRSIYYGFFIFFTCALVLMIFIERRKQHPHIILQTLAMLGLLMVLAIF